MAATEKDKMIDELIALTQTKKAEITKAEKPDWKTNSMFAFNNYGTETGVKYNLKTLNISDLISVLAHVTSRYESFAKANETLGTNEKFEYMGFSLEDWTYDIKARIAQITITSKRKELEKIEAQLDGMISKERREELQLAAIMATLKGDS